MMVWAQMAWIGVWLFNEYIILSYKNNNKAIIKIPFNYFLYTLPIPLVYHIGYTKGIGTLFNRYSNYLFLLYLF